MRVAAAILIVPVALAGVVLSRADTVDRLVHPGRYRTTGRTLHAPDAYVAAARAATDGRVAWLAFPRGDDPVTVAIAGARPSIVYLDPPTARVLSISPADRIAARPLAHPAQPVDAVIAQAGTMSRGATPRSIAWPTETNPDWTVTYADDAASRVKVADDTRRPLAARAKPAGAARWLPSVTSWWIVGALAGIGSIILLVVRRRRRAADQKRNAVPT